MPVDNTFSTRKSGMVHVRGGFSDANKLGNINHEIQVYEFDDRTRKLLTNKVHELIWDYIDGRTDIGYNQLMVIDRVSQFCRSYLNDVLGENNYARSYDMDVFFEKRIKVVYDEAKYNEVLDVTEYISRWCEAHRRIPIASVYDEMNTFFEQECIGYRFVDGSIVPIIEEHELESLESSLSVPFEGCRTHIQKAIGFLANRKEKDYKNSIKESISAVESVCQQLLKDSKSTLGEALKKLENGGITIHPALRDGFSRLYGYTSDQGGIVCSSFLMSTLCLSGSGRWLPGTRSRRGG